jgi:hypothetical protein
MRKQGWRRHLRYGFDFKQELLPQLVVERIPSFRALRSSAPGIQGHTDGPCKLPWIPDSRPYGRAPE